MSETTAPKVQIPIVQIRGLYFTYPEGNEDAIKNINLEIKSQSINVLIGPSGCGKTTILKCITGVIPKVIDGDLRGEILLNAERIFSDVSENNPENEEKSLSQIAKEIGFVLQEPDNQIIMTMVEDDIAFGPENMLMEPNEIRTLVDNMIIQTGLEGKGLENPEHLSGGEKQRLAIGGVLAMESDILVFDEPMSSLDKIGKHAFLQYIKTLRNDGKTIIIAEHDFDLLDFADKWIIMKNGEIVKVSPPCDDINSIFGE